MPFSHLLILSCLLFTYDHCLCMFHYVFLFLLAQKLRVLPTAHVMGHNFSRWWVFTCSLFSFLVAYLQRIFPNDSALRELIDLTELTCLVAACYCSILSFARVYIMNFVTLWICNTRIYWVWLILVVHAALIRTDRTYQFLWSQCRVANM
jgi:hypothetical protein